MINDLSLAVQRLAAQIEPVQDMVRGIDYLTKNHQRPARLSDVALQWITDQILTLKKASATGIKEATQTLERYRKIEAALYYAAQQASAQQYANTL
jgi:hypothetical protein